MEIIKYPAMAQLEKLLLRPARDTTGIRRQTSAIMQEVARDGDEALKRFTLKFDGISPEQFRVSKDEINSAEHLLSAELKSAMATAYRNIRLFHDAGRPVAGKIETQPGVNCWWEWKPIDHVGLYIPGGTAPLFSTVLMLGIPAQLAGCEQVVLCTPPDKTGKVHPAILYAAQLCGIGTVYKLGGAQAIAALTYGTASIAKVDKIFGPGNRYVFAAKQLAQWAGVAIDLPAGPSEVMVIADESANAAFIASDLLSQAEHGPDSQTVLLTTSETLAEQVFIEVSKQLGDLPRADIAGSALQNSKIIALHDNAQLLWAVNSYAPEHLIVVLQHPREFVNNVKNAGSVFIGPYTPEAAGDYASGTNHTLPTAGYARSYSGVSLSAFLKRITYQEITKQGLQTIGPHIIRMAEDEDLKGHARAVEIRLKQMKGPSL